MFFWNIDGLIFIECIYMLCILKMIEVVGIFVVELMDSKLLCFDIVVGFDNFEAVCQMIIVIIVCGYCYIVYFGVCFDECIIIKQKGYEQVMLDVGLVLYSVMVE